MSDLQKKQTKNQLFQMEQASSALSSKTLQEIIYSLKKGIPFPYLLNSAEFYQHSFYVNEHVLIPRPETELLVEKIVHLNQKFKTALDVGTGSGVIILSLLKAQVCQQGLGVDISPAALEVARNNAYKLRVKNASFQLSDRLQSVHEKFDLIVSNPPYIKPVAHKSGVHSKVDEFEPKTALYIPDGAYEKWFEDFFLQIKAHLNPSGFFCMEGHEQELQKQAQLLTKLGFKHVQVGKDWNDVDRFLFAQAE